MNEFEMPVAPLRSRLSVFSVERGTIEVDGSALIVSDVNGVRAQLPVGATAVLMLEPGTVVTHAAVRLCAESHTLMIWCGEGGVRIYSAAQEGAAHTYRLLRQARLALDPARRLAVARQMYRVRFGEEAPSKRSIEQLRGVEGARVRARYRELSAQFGVPWQGRNYDQSDWAGQDPVNKAVSAANSCLYGLCHAAILISGYSAAIGFIHTGYPLAFVHDIADLWKMDLSVPVGFQVVAEGNSDVATRARHLLRDRFRSEGLLERIIPRIEEILDAGERGEQTPEQLGGASIDASRPEDAPWYRNRNGPNSARADAAASAETKDELIAGAAASAASTDEDEEWDPFTDGPETPGDGRVRPEDVLDDLPVSSWRGNY